MNIDFPQKSVAISNLPADSSSSTLRQFQIGDFKVSCTQDQHGVSWNCRCPDFARLSGNGAHCSHVAMAIDMALEETSDKLVWHTQHQRAPR
jgi:hypothetical protein